MFVPQEQRQDGPKVGVIESVLTGTEDMLIRNGWVNGNPRRIGCPQTCIGIALATQARDHDVEYFHVHQRVLWAAQVQTGKYWRDIVDYNDAPGRTFDEVKEVLHLARNGAKP